MHIGKKKESLQWDRVGNQLLCLSLLIVATISAILKVYRVKMHFGKKEYFNGAILTWARTIFKHSQCQEVRGIYTQSFSKKMFKNGNKK